MSSPSSHFSVGALHVTIALSAGEERNSPSELSSFGDSARPARGNELITGAYQVAAPSIDAE